jgi:hypothetical protein
VPFTLVHPLAVVPLRRAGVFSALIIGSMVPDFARLASPFGEPHNHTWTGAILYYLPAALITLFVYHRLIKLPMISLSPRRIQPWLLTQSPAFKFLPLSRFAVILVSAFVGISTHLFWDSFTHNGGWVLRQSHLEATRVGLSSRYSLYVAEIFQDVSSIGGLLLLIYLLYRILSRHSVVSGERRAQLDAMPVLGLRRFALIAAGVVCAMVPACVMFARDPRYWLHDERRQFVGFTVISTMDIVLLEIVIFSVLWQVRHGARNSHGSIAGERQS